MAIQADCLFCTEDEPCATHVDKPTKSSPRKPRQPKPSASTPIVSPATPPSASADFVVPPKRDRFGTRAEAAVTLDDEDRMLKEALTSLWDMLAPSTKKKYRHIVEPPKNPAQSKRNAEVRRMLDGNA